MKSNNLKALLECIGGAHCFERMKAKTAQDALEVEKLKAENEKKKLELDERKMLAAEQQQTALLEQVMKLIPNKPANEGR